MKRFLLIALPLMLSTSLNAEVKKDRSFNPSRETAQSKLDFPNTEIRFLGLSLDISPTSTVRKIDGDEALTGTVRYWVYEDEEQKTIYTTTNPEKPNLKPSYLNWIVAPTQGIGDEYSIIDCTITNKRTGESTEKQLFIMLISDVESYGRAIWLSAVPSLRIA